MFANFTQARAKSTSSLLSNRGRHVDCLAERIKKSPKKIIKNLKFTLVLGKKHVFKMTVNLEEYFRTTFEDKLLV